MVIWDVTVAARDSGSPQTSQEKGDRAGFAVRRPVKRGFSPAVSQGLAMLKGFGARFAAHAGIVVGGGEVQSASVAR